MKKLTFISLVVITFFACKNATESTTPTEDQTQAQTPVTTDESANMGGAQNDNDLVAISDAVHNFYKWYETFFFDDKRSVPFIDFSGKTAKLDGASLAKYHAEILKSGLISQAFIDSDLAFLKANEAEWIKNKEDGGDGPLTGMDYERIFCGQDWDVVAYKTGEVKTELINANAAKANIQSSKLELVKENGKWLISKITCE